LPNFQGLLRLLHAAAGILSASPQVSASSPNTASSTTVANFGSESTAKETAKATVKATVQGNDQGNAAKNEQPAKMSREAALRVAASAVSRWAPHDRAQWVKVRAFLHLLCLQREDQDDEFLRMEFESAFAVHMHKPEQRRAANDGIVNNEYAEFE
jgi:hypothetical protein